MDYYYASVARSRLKNIFKMNKLIVAIVVILILVGGGYYLMSQQSSTEVISDEGGDVGNSMLMRLEDNAIYVADQKPGAEIKATVVNLKEAGYVVVHEIVDGKPGKIVGSSDLLPAGEHQAVSITLASAYEDGVRLIAMLHNDNGDSSFSAESDLSVKNKSGEVIMMEFGISLDASDNPVVNF